MKKCFLIVALTFLLATGITACGISGQAPNSQSLVEDLPTVLQDSQEGAAQGALEPESTPAQESPKSENMTTQEADEPSAESERQILVAYFSRADNIDFDPSVDATTSASINLDDEDMSGNAKLLAEMVQAVVGGDIFSIQTEEKYPAAYRATTAQAKTEQENDARPALAAHVDDMDSYDTVVLIYPNWWGGLPMPVYTFLEEHDFEGKTILPLCTHEGSGLAGTEAALADACPGATVLDGLSVQGGSAAGASADVEEWITSSGILDL